MVPPTLFVSGAIAVLHLCNEIYTRFRGVKRFRKDCEKLAHFVHRIEAFITETEDDADMTGPGWEAAFSALHDSLLEVVHVFESCAKYGMIRSLMNADELNLRLNAISQRLMMALQLIPIQKAKATDLRLAELKSIQVEIRSATFTAVRAAEEQSAALKRLMDQSRMDASRTQDMLEQVLGLLQSDPARQAGAAAAAAGPGPSEGGCGAPPGFVDRAQLEAEISDLHAELECAVRAKNVTEEEYLEQIIDAICAMEAHMQASAAPTPPVDLVCPITLKLLVDPVILVDSAQTYERSAIKEWLDRGNRKDPISGVLLSSPTLVPNIAVRKMAEDWLATHPDYKQQQEENAAACEAADAAAAAAAADQDDDPDGPAADCFTINPKTAAILAATGDGAGPSLGPPLKGSGSCGSSSGGAKGQLDEKQLAQQAYNRAVAAAAAGAAAAGTATVVAAPAFFGGGGGSRTAAAPAGSSQADRQYSVESSAAGSRCSSITFARGGSSNSLPSFSQNRRGSTPDEGLVTVGEAEEEEEEVRRWPGAEQQQQQQQQRQPSPQLLVQPSIYQPTSQQRASLQLQRPPVQHQQSLSERPSPFEDANIARRSFGALTMSRNSRQERAAAASAAAAAIAAQQRGGGLHLRDLHGALSKAGDTRYRMSMRYRGADAAEQVREQQEAVRQERAHARTQEQQEEERVYLQQHMERLMRSQSPEPDAARRLSASSVGANSATFGSGAAGTGLMSAGPSAADQAAGPSSSSGAAARRSFNYQRTCSVPDDGAQRAYALPPQSTSRDAPDNLPRVRTSFSAEVRPPSALSPSPAAYAPSVAGSNASCPEQGRPSSSGLGFGRFVRRTTSEAHAVQQQFDDTASISSTSSSSSRRSIGRSLLGALKSVKYSMVYDDTRC